MKRLFLITVLLLGFGAIGCAPKLSPATLEMSKGFAHDAAQDAKEFKVMVPRIEGALKPSTPERPALVQYLKNLSDILTARASAARQLNLALQKQAE